MDSTGDVTGKMIRVGNGLYQAGTTYQEIYVNYTLSPVV
jgi:hypothetical protein